MKELRQWQKDAYGLWVKSGFYGLIKARTGSGKTLTGIACANLYRQTYPFSRVLIVVPSAEIGRQWEEAMKEQALTDDVMDGIMVVSYAKGINLMYRKGLKAECLILDECHRVDPMKQSSQIMKINPQHVLGLSATPGNAVKVLGKPIYTVDWEEASLCPFYVHYGTFKPSKEGMEVYDGWTKKMKQRAVMVTHDPDVDYLPPGKDSRYDYFVRERRNVCYTFPERVKYTIDLIKTYKSKRMIVFAERNEQLIQIGKELDKEGIPYSACSQWKDTLYKFENKETNILLLCKKLREGWNDVTVEIEILTACTTRELSHTQVAGRVMRQDPDNPNKVAHIFALLADDTSDLSVIRTNDFPKDRTETVSVQKILDIAPGISERKMITKLI